MATPDRAMRAVLRRPFPEQIAAFRLRLGNLLPTEAWDELMHAAHDRAFVVAGATKADLLADFALAIDKSISQGTSLEEFRRDFRQIVERHGWRGWTGEGTAKGEAWRTKVIYKTNAATSYAAGRMAQLRAAGFQYFIYRHGGSEHPRHHHLEIDGLILRSDHPFWDIWAPPNGWGCSCYIVGAHSLAQAKRLGGNPAIDLPENWDFFDPETGAPAGIDKGWAYAPGGSVSDILTLAANKVSTLPPVLGESYARSLAGVIDRHWPVWLAEARRGKMNQPGLVGTLPLELRDDLQRRGREVLAPEVRVGPGLVVGPKATRHQAAGDALTDDVWERLPSLMRSAKAVLYDTASGRYLYILDPVDDAVPQLAVAIDFRMKVNRKNITTNSVRSAYFTNYANLARRIANGTIELIWGSVG